MTLNPPPRSAKWTLEGSKFKCIDCSSTFPSDAAAELHYKASHVVARPHSCLECQIAFKDLWHLKRHLYIHGIVDADTPQVRNTCSLCKASFPDSWHLNKHLRTHETGDFTVRKTRGGRKRGRGQSNLISMLPPKTPGADWGGDGSAAPTLYSPQQFIENYQSVSELKPEAMEFYCGICGFGVARSKFSPHSLSHMRDVFEVRKGKAVGDVASMLLEGGEKENCGQCEEMVKTVEQLLHMIEDQSS